MNEQQEPYTYPPTRKQEQEISAPSQSCKNQEQLWVVGLIGETQAFQLSSSFSGLKQMSHHRVYTSIYYSVFFTKQDPQRISQRKLNFCLLKDSRSCKSGEATSSNLHCPCAAFIHWFVPLVTKRENPQMEERGWKVQKWFAAPVSR